MIRFVHFVRYSVGFVASLISCIAWAQTDLNVTLTAGGTIAQKALTSDGTMVVYRADAETAGQDELYSLSTSGGSPTKLNDVLPSGGEVRDFLISDDGVYVVYEAGQNTSDIFELFSVPIGGGTVNNLSGTIVADGDVRSFLIAPGSNYVIIDGDLSTNNVFELYSVPIAGGSAPTKLNGTMVSGGDITNLSDPYQVSADGNYVVYRADEDVNNRNEVFSVPIAGGVSVKLNGTVVSGGNTERVLISPNSDSVIFIGDHDIVGVDEIYAAPITGGSVVKLNPALPSGRSVTTFNFDMASDGTTTWVLYRADQDADNVFEIYSVPITGGTPTKLNGALPSGGNVLRALISPDGTTVVYVADQDVVNQDEIYAVPIEGGANTKLNGPVVSGGDVSLIFFNPVITDDNSRVIYKAQHDEIGTIELYSALLDGSGATKLHPSYVLSDSDIQQVRVSPDGSTVTYRADQDINDVFELYQVSAAGGTPVKLHSDLTTADISSIFSYSASSGDLIFRGDTDEDGTINLLFQGSSTLPVELVYFTASRRSDSEVLLSWSTEGEIDNEGFVIEVANNGLDFEPAAFVKGGGTTDEPLGYSYILESRSPAYYRLKQVDFDGDFEYGPVEFVAGPGSVFSFSVAPNPTTGPIEIRLNADGNDNPLIDLTVMDINGQVLVKDANPVDVINESLSRYLSKLPTGIYLFEIRVGTNRLLERIVVH
ncbi:MAG: T9SS type A sorting domain-containing protein [Bacteroidota bacterium]